MKKSLILLLVFTMFLFGCSANYFTANNIDPVQSSFYEDTQTELLDIAETTEFVEAEDEFDPMAIVCQMSDEELVGQLFLATCLSDSQALTDISAYHLGGYALYSRDFENETPSSVLEKINTYQAVSDIPLLIVVDEEGGTVTRISRYEQFRHEPFESPRKLYNTAGMDAIEESEREKCMLLTSLGVNANFGPVCDIAQNRNAFMYYRSLGEDAQTTAEFVRIVVQTMDDYNTGSILKHFPGYGENSDTHVGIAIDDRTLDALEMNDIIPFQAGIEAGCDAIMISHTFINCIDPAYPASLSPKVVEYLRTELGFDGVIMTDNLSMNAITDQYGDEESVILALEAGVDILCSTDYQIQYAAVLQALQDQRLSRSQLEQSVCRILLWKHELGLL